MTGAPRDPAGADLGAWLDAAAPPDAGRTCEWTQSGTLTPAVQGGAKTPRFFLHGKHEYVVWDPYWESQWCDQPATTVVLEPILPTGTEHRRLCLCPGHAAVWRQLAPPVIARAQTWGPVPALKSDPT